MPKNKLKRNNVQGLQINKISFKQAFAFSALNTLHKRAIPRCQKIPNFLESTSLVRYSLPELPLINDFYN